MPVINDTTAVTNKRYELRSEEVQEIMSKMPHWLIRRGIYLMLLLIVALLIAAWFIKYPDVVMAKITISSANPPVQIEAKNNGAIQELYVNNQQMVAAGEILGVIENTANAKEVQQLKKLILPVDTATQPEKVIAMIDSVNFSKLGSLQSFYADWQQAVDNYRFFKNNDYYAKKINQYKSQIGTAQKQKKYLKNDSGFANKQLCIEKARLKRDSILLSQKVISPAEFEARNKDYLSQQRNSAAAGSGIIQSDMANIEYQKAITDIEQQQLKEKNDRIMAIQDITKRLLAQIDSWEQQYLIKTPVAGKVIFFKYWKENQVVKAGETVVTVVPPVQQYIARAFVPVQGAGKIKQGQEALIKLDAFPYHEFGMLRGKVSFMSPVAIDTAFPIDIELVQGMKTAVNKEIPAQPEYTGFAEIITEDKNILQRIFEKIWVSRKR
jgi:multidrug resistance efflux pump